MGAHVRAAYLHRRSADLRALLNRMNSWNRDDREELFNLAFIDGKAAQFAKPDFLREPAAKVRKAMEFLFHGKAPAHVRFEFVAANGERHHLQGLGRAGVAMLMHLWKPREYGIWNASVDAGFNVLKVRFNRSASKHIGQAYRERTSALKMIKQEFNFGSLAETDYFVDAFGKGFLKL